MRTILALTIIVAAVFVGIASMKYGKKPYIMNFALSVLMLLLVIQSSIMQPITTLGIAAIIICSIAFVFQLVLGVRNVKAKERAQA